MKNLAFYAVVVMGYLAYGAVTNADRDSSGAIVGEGTIDAFSMRVGDCFDDSSVVGDEVTNLPGVPPRKCVVSASYASAKIAKAAIDP